ncbi:MAG: HAMP domain-containing histidine kinase [Anaerolineaceae bacterium]|nr:HAMP domain-containing histidine kinase [Anaerolineaceae bacterium]
MKSISFKLIGAFLLVSLVGVGLVAVISRIAGLYAFEQLLIENAQNDFMEDVSTYYLEHGTWKGIAEQFNIRVNPGEIRPQITPEMRNVETQVDEVDPAYAPPQPLTNQAPPPLFALVNPKGFVVLSSQKLRLGERIPLEKMLEGEPIEIEDEVVGYIIRTGVEPQRDPREILYIQRTDQASLWAALGAVAIALLLGIVLAGRLTKPLKELTKAIRGMQDGKLKQQVPVRSEDEMGELSAAFNKMSAELERANHLRIQMTADVAHDLSSPLTVISGYIEALRDGILEPSAERYDMLFEETMHLQKLVKDMRLLNHADSGNLRLKLQNESIRETLQDVLDEYQFRADKKQIALESNFAPHLPEILMDEAMTKIVFKNLLSNAIRHSPQGGGVYVSAQQGEDVIMISIRDTGKGIARKDKPFVFERFYRGDKSRYQDESEIGLGLALSKSIIELHGGTIDVESEVGQGAKFIVCLPTTASLSKHGLI